MSTPTDHESSPSQVLAIWSSATEESRVSAFERNREISLPVRRTDADEKLLAPFQSLERPFWRSTESGQDISASPDQLAAVSRIDADGQAEVFSDGRPAALLVGEVPQGGHVFVTERIEDAFALNKAAGAPVFAVPSAAQIQAAAKAISDADPSLSITVFSSSLGNAGPDIERASVFNLPGWIEKMDMGIPDGALPHGILGAHGDQIVQKLVNDALQAPPEIISTTPWVQDAEGAQLRTVVGKKGGHYLAGVQASKDGKEQDVSWEGDRKFASVEEAALYAKEMQSKRALPEGEPDAAAEQGESGAISGNKHEDIPINKTDEILGELKRDFIVSGTNFYLRDDKKVLAFVDDGGFIRTTHENGEIIKRMLDLAEAKGWASVHLAGTDEFRRKAWLEAQIKGLQTTGYEPDEWDKEQLAQRIELIKGGNSIGDSRLAKDMPPVSSRTPPATGNSRNVVDINKARTERYAKPVAAALKQTGVASPEIDLTLDALAKTVDPNRTHVGELIEHGAANYKFEPDQAENYFIRLKLDDGSEKVLWGVDFRGALERTLGGPPSPGDYILIGFEGSKPVSVPNPKKKGEWINTKRNEWLAERVSDLPARLRKRNVSADDGPVGPIVPDVPVGNQATDLAGKVAQVVRSRGGDEQAVKAATAALDRGLAAAGTPSMAPSGPGVSPAVAPSPSLSL